VNANSPRGPSLSTSDERGTALSKYVALWSDEPDDAPDDGASVDEMLASSPPEPPSVPHASVAPDATAPEDPFATLERAHIEGERWEALVELYLARLEGVESHERPAILRRIANVFEHGLEDERQALDAYASALAEDLYDQDTAREVERLAHATGRWNEVLSMFVGALRDERDPARRVRLCLHLAKWYGDDLGRPEHAQPYYVQILQLDANNVEAMRQLAILYGKAGNWAQMGTTLTRALEVVVIDADRKQLLTDIGALLDSLGETDRALVYLKQATVVDPGFLPALDHLARIHAARDEHAELIAVREAQIASSQEAHQIAAWKIEVAGLLEGSDPARAAKHYKDVADADPSNVHALRGLVRAYELLGDWQALARTLEALLDVVTTGKARIEILVELANVYEEHFLKSDLAAIRLEQVLEIDPNDMGAFFELERNYRKRRMFTELVATYERHIAATFERKAKVHLYGEIAALYENEMCDVDGAIATYHMVVALDEANVPALEALAKLHEKAGDTAQAIRCMKRVAMLTDEDKRADAFYRIGKTLEEKLGNKKGAKEIYEQALDVDDAHLPSLAALRQIAVEEGDFEKAVRLLDIEQSHAPASRHRAKLLAELARIREEALGDHESAVMVWEEALATDPESLDSVPPLAAEYIATEQWEKAEPLLDRLARKAAASGDRGAQHDVQHKLGAVCAALGKNEKAVKAFRAAHELDVTDKATMRGLADACFAAGDYATAHTSYARLLAMLGEDEPAVRADSYYKLGCIKRAQGRPKQAVGDFERALGVDGSHRPTLDALVALYTELRDWKAVAAYKRATLPTLGYEEQLTVLCEIADVWTEAREPALAAEALEEARAIRSGAALLHRLLAAYQEARDWPRAIATIRAIAELDRDPAHRAKLYFTIGRVYEDELRDEASAASAYDESLDACATYLQSFERINKILTARKDWKALERAFRKMLRRLSIAGAHDADLEYTLWHNLGLIYRDRLKDAPSAIEALKMATRFKPDDALERQILAELYEAAHDIEGAASEHTIVLQNDPLRVDPYRSLCKLFLREKSYDRAWCACAALAVLGKADAEERRFYEGWRPSDIPQVKSRLVNDHWMQLLVHKDCDLYIGKIMEMITPAAILAKTNELRASGKLPVLPKRSKEDPQASPLRVAKMFGWAAQVLGITQPELYVRDDVPGAFAAVPAVPPATIAGQTAMSGLSPQQLAFVIGKHLAGYRGEQYIRNLFPTLAELKVLFFAAVKIVKPDAVVPAELVPAIAVACAELSRHMQPIQREGLRLVVDRWMADGAKADLRRWMQTTDVTAARAGLLLCGDLEVARRIVAAEPQLPGDLSPTDKLKELVVFSVSEQYAQLRAALGIGVVVAN